MLVLYKITRFPLNLMGIILQKYYNRDKLTRNFNLTKTFINQSLAKEPKKIKFYYIKLYQYFNEPVIKTIS